MCNDIACTACVTVFKDSEKSIKEERGGSKLGASSSSFQV